MEELRQSCINGNLTAVEELSRRFGVETIVNSDLKDPIRRYNSKCLHLAIESQEEDLKAAKLIWYLLQNGADPHKKDDNSW